MKLGILVTSIGNFGRNGYYNAQEIGLAKELAQLVDKVVVYKLIPESESEIIEELKGYKNIQVHEIPSKYFGINGIVNVKKLDSTLDGLIYFSDTQLVVPRVYKWCINNRIKMIPYIGVTESHSNNMIKKFLINTLFKRNVSIYKKCECLVKNPQVELSLNKHGVSNISICPVGLDLSLLNKSFNKVDRDYLKEKWNYLKGEKILLFIGRLVSEKEPLKLIQIFKKVYMNDSNYKLLIVGNGELKKQIRREIEESDLVSAVRLIDEIPNTDIWELYRISEAYINLNQNEIFGMAILEAMYYGCKVIAWEAPGPSYIIEEGISGYLVSSEDAIIEAIYKQNPSVQTASYERIINSFTWKKTAEIIYSIIMK